MGIRWEIALFSAVLSLGAACADTAQRSEAVSAAGTGGAAQVADTSKTGAEAGRSAIATAGRAGNASSARSAARAGASAGAANAGASGVESGAAVSGGRADPAAGGGTMRGAAGSGAESGSGGTPGAAGDAADSGCSRALLQASLDAYFTALAAHDPAGLVLADNVKATENGKTIELGTAGLWTSAGMLQHAHSALDTEECTAISQAVVPDGSMPIPFALRLKLEQQKITEIETIAVRQGDYMLASNTSALSASAMTVHWQELVPADQRNTRAELAAWMDKYFRLFPRGVCDTTSDCKRIENGGGSFNCSAGASCADSAPGPSDRALEPRLILVDVEAGLGVGFTMFQSNTDMHMFKMYGDKVYGVSAILAKADSSGWD